MALPAGENPFLAAVSAYREAGWQGTLPLAPGSKWPPPTGYTGREGTWPDDRALGEFARRSDANVALRLPKGVVGIDVDHYDGKRGGDTLDELQDRYGDLPPSWVSTSRPPPSGIRWYRCPDDLELPGVAGKAIEVIQHHHRYAVVAPSVVEGRRYRWVTPEGELAKAPPRPEDLPWLPEAWHALRPVPLELPERLNGPRLAVANGDWSRAVNEAYDKACLYIAAPGGRHDAALPAVMTLVRLDHSGHPGAQEALEHLHARFVLAISDRANPKEAESEWERMVAGAARKVAATPATREPYEVLVDRARTNGQASVPELEPDVDPLAHMHFVDWAEFWAEEATEEWLAEPLIPKGRAVAIAATAKVGKSLLLLDIAAGLATGRSVLGQPAQAPVHVLYCDYEMTKADLRERLEDLGYGPDVDMSHLHYAHLPSLPPLDTAAGGQALLAAALACQAQMVAIDTLARAVEGSENDADTYRQHYLHTVMLLKQHGVTTVRLDHLGKDRDKGARGSSAKNDDVDVVWQMSPSDNGVQMKRTHSRVPWVPESVAIARHVDPLRHAVVGHLAWPEGTKECADAIDELDLPADVSKRAAREALRAVGKGRGDSIVRAALKYRKGRKAIEGVELTTPVPPPLAPPSVPPSEPQEWF